MASGYSSTILGGSESYRGSYLEGSDELLDFTCSPCEDRNNATVQASLYCSVCDEFYCKPCLQVHNSFKANKSHIVYGRDKMEYWGQAKSSRSLLPTEECPDHPGEWLKMICLNHTTLCCSSCVVYSHRTCPDMKYLTNITKGIKESQDMSSVGHTIDQFVKFVEEMLEFDKKAQTTIEKSKTDVLDTINAIRKQANDFFTTIEKMATTEMDKCHAETKTGLLQHLKDLNDTKEKLTQLQMTIQPSSTNNEVQMFIKMFMAQKQLPEMQTQLQKLTQTPKTTTFSLTKDPKLQEMFSTVKSLGKVEEEITKFKKQLPNIKPLSLLQPTPTPPQRPSRRKQTSATSSTSSVATTSRSVQSSKTLKQQQTQSYKATNGRDINVKIQSDKHDCIIHGSCQMPNGDILLTDCNNGKIKRLNTNYEPFDYLRLNIPYDICCIGDEEAVATNADTCISLLSITNNKMAVTKSFRLNHRCHGIAHNNGRLFVSNGGTKVNIYTTSGKWLNKMRIGLPMLTELLHVGVSPDGSTVYVSDSIKGLVSIDNAGYSSSTYSSGVLREACGICVDSQGRVLVCGNHSHNVLQLKEGGHSVVCGGDCFEHPKSLCIDNHNSRLIVSMTSEFKYYNHITVFDLKLDC